MVNRLQVSRAEEKRLSLVNSRRQIVGCGLNSVQATHGLIILLTLALFLSQNAGSTGDNVGSFVFILSRNVAAAPSVVSSCRRSNCQSNGPAHFASDVAVAVMLLGGSQRDESLCVYILSAPDGGTAYYRWRLRDPANCISPLAFLQAPSNHQGSQAVKNKNHHNQWSHMLPKYTLFRRVKCPKCMMSLVHNDSVVTLWSGATKMGYVLFMGHVANCTLPC